MSQKPLTAFVIGATGSAGLGIVKALLENPNFEKVTIIGHEKFDLQSILEHPNYGAKFDEKLIDFPVSFHPSDDEDELLHLLPTFTGYDVGFCAFENPSPYIALIEELYYHINHDIVVNTAKLAKKGGCKHYHYISGQSASKTSRFYWARVKAEVEEELKGMGFDRLSIYRPAVIVNDSADRQTKLEAIGNTAFKFLDPFNFMSIHSHALGKAVVQNTLRVFEGKEETLENGDILKLAKEFDKQQ